MDESLINEFFDLQAYEQQAQQLLASCQNTAKKLKENFSQVSGGIGTETLLAYRAGVEKVSQATSKAKAAVSEYSKAIEKHNKVLGEQALGEKDIEQALGLQANTIAELTAKNRVLESVRKNLNIADAKYAENQKKLIDAQNKNIELIKQYQNVDQKRTSGIGKYQEAIERALGGQGNYRQQLMNLRNTMADLEQQIEKTTEEFGAESPQVKELQEQYDVLQKKAGRLSDAQGDMQARIKYLADDYGKFKATLQGLQAAMGIVSVFQGFTSLLGIHNENIEKVVKNMTALIAVMKGLQEVQELLNKDNYFIQMIKNTPALRKVFTTIKAGINAIGLSVKSALGIVGAAAAAITALILVMKKLNEKHEDQAKIVEDNLKKQASQNLLMQETFHTIETNGVKSLVNLNVQWRNLGNNLSEKKRFIKENQEAFKSLGLKIDDVTDAEKRLSNEGLQAYIKYIVGKNKVDLVSQEIAQKEIELAKKNAVVAANIRQKGIFGANLTAGVDLNTSILRSQINDLYKTLGVFTEEAEIYKKNAGIIDETNQKIANSNKKTTESTKKEIETIDDFLKNIKNLGSSFKTSGYFDNLQYYRDLLTSGKITMKEFDDAVLKLNFDFEKNSIQNAIDDLQEYISLTGGSAEATEKLVELQRKLNDINFDEFVRKNKEASKEVEEATEEASKKFEISWETKLNAVLDVFGAFADSLASISASIYETQIDKLDKLSESQTAQYQNQKNLIENTITDEEEKEKALTILENERLEKEKEITRQKAEIERRKAKFDVAITTTTALATAAASIAEAIKTAAAAGDPYTLAVRIAAAIAAVVAGIAAVTSALAKVSNIPAYERGGLSPKNKPFRAGEKGFEIGIGEQSGKPYLFAKDSVYLTPERVAIMPHSESKRAASATTINNNKNVRLKNEVVVKVVNQSRVERYFNI